MKLVIDIPEENFNILKQCIKDIDCKSYSLKKFIDGIIDGTPLPKGKWIRKERDDGIYCECSNCGHWSLLDYDYTGFEDDSETWAMFDFDTVPLKNKNYCSSCGAEMEV